MVRHGKYNVYQKYRDKWSHINNHPLIYNEAKEMLKLREKAGYEVKLREDGLAPFIAEGQEAIKKHTGL